MIREWKIGGFQGRSPRKRPNAERIASFMKDNTEVWKDFDVYLCGSYPHNNQTWDADFLVHAPGGLTTEEMEDMSIKTLENSLLKNHFLADIGFTDNNSMYNFNEMIERYNATGEPSPTKGYIYADKWMVDGNVFRDRNKLTEGSIERLDNNIWKKSGAIPYPKMRANLKANQNYYKDKPMLVSKAGGY